MRDTEPAAESIRVTAVRRLPPAVRMRQALDLSEWARKLAMAGLRERHPASSDLELAERLRDTHSGRPARTSGDA